MTNSASFTMTNKYITIHLNLCFVLPVIILSLSGVSHTTMPCTTVTSRHKLRRKKSCHHTRHRTPQVDHAENGHLWWCDDGCGIDLARGGVVLVDGFRGKCQSASRTRGALPGPVGDRINYFGLSHKFTEFISLVPRDWCQGIVVHLIGYGLGAPLSLSAFCVL